MINFLQGDVLDKLKELDNNSIDCVVTSPPYWGLRDYGTASYDGGDPNCQHTITDGIVDNKNNKLIERPDRASDKKNCVKCGAKRIDKQLGLEPTYQEHIQNIVELFRAMKPKLKDSATVWLNYGDSYAATVNGTKVKDMKKNLQKNRIKNKGKTNGVYDDRGFIDKPFSTIQGSLKPKDLVMVPNRIAIALQDDGWWIRSEIIWHKPNPMPESTKDRPTSAHEKIWLITKNKKYYYDADAIREPTTDSYKGKRGLVKKRNKTQSAMQDRVFNIPYRPSNTKNKRNVWTITTKPCKEAHFATFPKDLIEPCIKAGCPEKVCVECGTPYKKNYNRKRIRRDELDPADHRYRPNKYKGAYEEINGKGDAGYQSSEFIGFEKDCNCKTDKFESGVVLDPFGGSGTTGIVAQSLNRKSIMIELNPEYIKIAKKRIEKELGLFG